jgi:carbamoyltransferase
MLTLNERLGKVNKILGISAMHDSSICILENGKILNFLKEERVSKIKRDMYPVKSFFEIDLKEDLVDVAYSAPSKDDTTYPMMKTIIEKNFNIDQTVDYSDEHHLVHANLAFYNSGFSQALVFVIDRNGSVLGNSLRESESVYLASYPNNFKPLCKNFWVYDNYGHEHVNFLKGGDADCDFNAKSMFGIVKVYESATTLIGQSALENGKTMGLSAYGNKDKDYPKLFTDGFIPLDYHFGHEYAYGTRATNYTKLKDKSTKNVNINNHQEYSDHAWNVQKETQEAVASMINMYVEKTGVKNVCITGGYGLNVVANHYYITQFPEVNFFFEPLADDSGNSIGAAMKYYRDTTLDCSINKLEHTFFNGKNYPLDNIKGLDVSVQDVAKLISNGKSVAIYNGLSEAGPRALGNRSILFDCRDKDAKEKVNKIKKREWYRPFAAMVLEEESNQYFEMGRIKKSEFMTISFPVKDAAIKKIPGVVHVDNTCRIQTVDSSNPIIFNLLNEFKKITNIGILLNTSFNLAGMPLVEKPEDAFYTLRNSELDYVWFPEICKLISKADI